MSDDHLLQTDPISEYGSVPLELKAHDIWLPFRTSPRPSGGLNKRPYSRTGHRAHFTNPAVWMSFDDAVGLMNRRGYDGIGIVASAPLGIMLIDFDHCIVDGVLKSNVSEYIQLLDTYTERSFSGDGLHAIALGKLPWKKNRDDQHGIEMYDDGRFFVVTGQHVVGTPTSVMQRQSQIERIHLDIFGPKQIPETTPSPKRDTTALYTEEEEGGEFNSSLCEELPDEIVLDAILRDAAARNVFCDGAGAMNASGADFALCCKLAFYTRKNLAQMKRLFLKSALVRQKTLRPTGDSDYLTHTCRKAISRTTAVWNRGKPARHRQPGVIGRPKSENRLNVTALHARQPEMRSVDIARHLGIKENTVRQILCRERKRTSGQPISSLAEGTPSNIPEAPAPNEKAGDGGHDFGGRPALMSCPRHVRHLYPQAEGRGENPREVPKTSSNDRPHGKHC